MERDWLTLGPSLGLAFGELRHQLGEAFHLLPVKGGQHQLALLEVVAFVEQDHGVATYHGLQNPRSLPGMQDLCRCSEERLDLIRVGEHHERRRGEKPDREPLAVAGTALLHEGDRPRPPAQRLHDARLSRSRRKLGAHRSPPTYRRRYPSSLFLSVSRITQLGSVGDGAMIRILSTELASEGFFVNSAATREIPLGYWNS